MTLPDSVTMVSSWTELIAALHSPNMMRVQRQGPHLRSPYVFRGADDAEWLLDTSLNRLMQGLQPPDVDDVERALIRSFRKYANAGGFDDRSEWYVLAVGQHNGLPTRCLDWTVSPLVAAHFACADDTRKTKDGVIWCLNAQCLRAINEGIMGSDPLDKAWFFDTRRLESTFPEGLTTLDKKPDERPDLLLLWEPPSLDARIANQYGLLSLLNDPAGSQTDYLARAVLDEPDLVRRIEIKAEAKSEIRDMLDQNNISERTLFPGLPGLCDWLRRYYGRAW